ncbi:DivIVA domain-containing protein [Lactobacillus rossiae]|uniref:DivIVA domain-containing protein n=3 Tax=Lactobacillaceae TaxID=33958 RepID=A0A6N9I560_9LACO|nr:DivIVA domain-containing protein [Furfurilactobacillus milii]MYV18111.1 DivIVA domain-containing protein [Furfurilactobacillus milii]
MEEVTMALSPMDIHNKEFTRKGRNGYAAQEVDDFLDEVIASYQQVLNQNKDLQDQLDKANHNLSQYDEMKNSLNQSILVAQEAADKVKQEANTQANSVSREAQQQAQAVVAEAQAKAGQITSDAANNAARLNNESNALREETKTFQSRLAAMLQSQLDLVHSDNWNELLQPTGLESYPELQDAISKTRPSHLASSPATVGQTSPAPTSDNSPVTADQPQTVVIFPENSGTGSNASEAQSVTRDAESTSASDDPTK